MSAFDPKQMFDTGLGRRSKTDNLQPERRSSDERRHTAGCGETSYFSGNPILRSDANHSSSRASILGSAVGM